MNEDIFREVCTNQKELWSRDAANIVATIISITGSKLDNDMRTAFRLAMLKAGRSPAYR